MISSITAYTRILSFPFTTCLIHRAPKRVVSGPLSHCHRLCMPAFRDDTKSAIETVLLAVQGRLCSSSSSDCTTLTFEIKLGLPFHQSLHKRAMTRLNIPIR